MNAKKFHFNFHKAFAALICLVLALALAGCGTSRESKVTAGASAATPTPAPTASATPSPTPTASPAPTATPVPTVAPVVTAAPTATPTVTASPVYSYATATPELVWVGQTSAPQTTVTSAPSVFVTETPQTVYYYDNTTASSSNSSIVITKHPTGETVTEGGTAIFIAQATGYTNMYWQLVSPDGQTVYPVSMIGQYFSGVTADGFNSEKLRIHYVTSSLNGWKARAVFYNGTTEVYSNPAAMTIPGFFTQIPSSYTFSSGAGAWSTELTVYSDGSFAGTFHDWDATNDIDGDPNHSVRYECSFTGRFGNVQKIDGYSYSMTLQSLNYTPFDSYLDGDGMWHVSSDPYGLTGGQSFTVYLPGISISALPEGFQSWIVPQMAAGSTTFNGYGIYNVNAQTAFVSN